MDITVSKKLFFPFPDSNDVVSQTLNSWENRNAKDLPGPKLVANLVNRYESQQFSCAKFNPQFT